jgi:AAA family ATP:ADP antiporter
MKGPKALVDVRREEIPLVALMFSYFFLVITVFWILKPIKKTVFIAYYAQPGVDFMGLDGPEAELLAKVGNMFVAYGAVIAFTMLSNSLRRQQLTFVFSGFCVAVLAAFCLIIDDPSETTSWSFYLFGDLFNTLMVATFFAFLNDSVAPHAAKRLYGPIVLGGVSGGAFGSIFVAALTRSGDLSNVTWILLCITGTLLIAAVGWGAGREVTKNPPPEEPQKPDEEPASRGNPAVEGARLVFRSSYLLSIVAIVALYEIVSTILDYQFTATLVEYADDFGAAISTVYAITNVTALLVQIFLTTLVLEKFGLKIALLVMPIAILAGSFGFLAIPLLLTGSALNTVDNGLNYSINQSAREALYTATSREEKYKAKAFIDMFVQRFAKAIAVGIALAMGALFEGFESVRYLSLITIVLVGAWFFAARYAGQRFDDITEGQEQAPQ